MTRVMLPVALSLLASLDALPATSPPSVSPTMRAWWCPTVTLRVTHLDARALVYDATDHALVPWGTTFELRLEWGATRAAVPVDLDPWEMP